MHYFINEDCSERLRVSLTTYLANIFSNFNIKRNICVKVIGVEKNNKPKFEVHIERPCFMDRVKNYFLDRVCLEIFMNLQQI